MKKDPTHLLISAVHFWKWASKVLWSLNSCLHRISTLQSSKQLDFKGHYGHLSRQQQRNQSPTPNSC